MSSSVSEMIKKAEKRKINAPISMEPIKKISTGSLILDYELGGGWGVGRISTIHGLPASGKTSLVMLSCIQAIRDGKNVLFINNERTFQPDRAYISGMGKPNIDYALFEPVYAEEAFDIVLDVVRSGDADLIVIDSISLPTKAQTDSDAEKAHMGSFARVLNSFLQKVVSPLTANEVTLLVVSQERAKLGGYVTHDRNQQGGNALRFYQTLELKLDKAIKEKQDGEEQSVQINYEIKKNKLDNNVDNKGSFSLYVKPRIGTNEVGELIELGRELCILTKEDGSPIQKSNASHWYGEIELGAGNTPTGAFRFIKQDRDIFESIREDIIERVNLGV